MMPRGNGSNDFKLSPGALKRSTWRKWHQCSESIFRRGTGLVLMFLSPDVFEDIWHKAENCNGLRKGNTTNWEFPLMNLECDL